MSTRSFPRSHGCSPLPRAGSACGTATARASIVWRSPRASAPARPSTSPTALQQVTQRHYPDLTLEVYETRGSLHKQAARPGRRAACARCKPIKPWDARRGSSPSSIPTPSRSWSGRDSGIERSATSSASVSRCLPSGAANLSPFWLLAKHTRSPPATLKGLHRHRANHRWLLINSDVDAAVPRARSRRCRRSSTSSSRVDGKVIPIPQAAGAQA